MKCQEWGISFFCCCCFRISSPADTWFVVFQVNMLYLNKTRLGSTGLKKFFRSQKDMPGKTKDRGWTDGWNKAPSGIQNGHQVARCQSMDIYDRANSCQVTCTVCFLVSCIFWYLNVVICYVYFGCFHVSSGHSDHMLIQAIEIHRRSTYWLTDILMLFWLLRYCA